VLITDLTLSSLGQSTPSTLGILMGDSTTAPAHQAPGGANCNLRDVAIYLGDTGNTVPIYVAHGTGTQYFLGVWTLGEYGIYYSATNELGVSSPFVTFGPQVGSGGVSALGCNLLGYGTAPVLVIEGCYCMTFDKLYTVTIRSGPGYAGQPYSIRLKNVFDIKINVENDYFPCVLFAEGFLDRVVLEGLHFPASPIPPTAGLLATFACTHITNSSFLVFPNSGPIANFLYVMSTAPRTLEYLMACRFLTHSSVTTNVMFADTAPTAHPAPFFNLHFDGIAGAGTYTWLIEGGLAPDTARRVFINGVVDGTA
jgi:hypothetical protein